jgi:FkbM family methyltransferase
MLDGFWEIWLTQFIARVVKPNMTVIDVGANFGYYTLLLADIVGPKGRVIAVEPNTDAVALLRESVLLNGFSSRTDIVPHALTASSGHAWLYVPLGEPKNATIVSGPHVMQDRTRQVSTVTLDDIACECQRIDLVKIDAEGSEVDIIAGMQKTIARHRPMIVLEFNAGRYVDPRAFLDSLLGAYGTFSELSPDGTLRQPEIATVADPAYREDRLLIFK